MSRAYLLVSISLIICLLSGCGKDNTTSGGVVISVGDKSNTESQTNDLSKGFENSTSSVADATDETDSTYDEDVVANDNEQSIVGSWYAEDGSYITFSNNGSFNAYSAEAEVYINGSYETDSKTMITLVYLKDNLDRVLEDGSIDYSQQEKIKITNDLAIDAIQLEVEPYELVINDVKLMKDREIDVISNDELNTATVEEEIISEEELERIKQDLINQGINPETGLTFEEEQKMLESGIDPSSRQPMPSETPEEEISTGDMELQTP